MSQISITGKQAPSLQISDWVQGKPTHLNLLLGNVILIEVFQVNCPGCFLYSLPQALDLHQRYYDKGLIVLGLATAFEDYDLNTLKNLELLMHQDKVVGETLRVLEENKRLIDGCLPYHISFPVAMDKISKQQKEFTEDDVSIFIKQHVPDFVDHNKSDQKLIRKKALSYFDSRLYTAESFNLYNLQGTPSHIIIDKQGILRACELGHFSDLEWLITSLLHA